MNRIFNQTNGPIGPLDETVMDTTRRLWDRKAKPLGSLGRLEDMVVQLGGIFGTEHIDISKKAVIVMAADNGVIREGVAQSDAHVTSTVVGNMARGASTVSILAQMAGADVFPVDIGMADDLFCPGVLNRKVRRGTDNIAMGPAMSRAEAVRAMEIGIEIVGMLYKRGYRLIATGEMGIGNTTTSSAMAAVYLGLDAAKVTGRGAGLDRQGYEKKIQVIRQAIKKNHPDANDGLDVLHKVGGLDIAGLTGCFIGGAIYRVPVVVDGLISAVAALTAVRLAPGCREYMFPSHCSAEPAGRRLLNALNMTPYIDAGMCLGEGTGAVTAFHLFDTAVTAFYRIPEFEAAHIPAYKRHS